MNFWNAFRVDVDFRVIFLRGHDLLETMVHLRKEFLQVEPQMSGAIWVEIFAAADVQLAGSSNVSVAKMMQRDGRLNQALVKLPVWAVFVLPQLFPYLVAFEKFTLVEVFDALQIQRMIIRAFRHNG